MDINMDKIQKSGFEVSVSELENRHEEQSALTALLAIAGAAVALDAQAAEPSATPSCTIFSW